MPCKQTAYVGKRGYTLVGFWPHQIPEHKITQIQGMDAQMWHSTTDFERVLVAIGRQADLLDMFYNAEMERYELRTRWAHRLVAYGSTPENAIKMITAIKRVKGEV